MKLENPWRQNPWFESVAVAQERVRKRLPKPVYAALVAGSERGQTVADNQAAFAEIGLSPHVAGLHAERVMARRVLGHDVSMPVLISPTGVQAVHPEGEVAVARAAAARGTIMGLSNFASRPVEEVVEAGAPTFFQMYWTGDREVMVQRMERACHAGVVGLIATLDWSFSVGRDWGSPESPEKVDLKAMVRMAPKVAGRPRWVAQFARAGGFPDLTAPNLAPAGGEAPTFFGAYYEWMTTAPPSWDDVAWMRQTWADISGTPFVLKGSAGSTTRCERLTPAAARSRSPTTAATTSTAPRPRSAACTRSRPRSATRSRCCSTAASAGARTWSRPSPSAPGRS
jgi:isopentenyl diphosphate isomerase/L-lactate dehydrogenase-like FMN-dependent dehydrogenase